MLNGEIAKVPQGRLGEMEEIADSIMFLASPLSSFMCGSGLVVDGKSIPACHNLRYQLIMNDRLPGGFTAGCY